MIVRSALCLAVALGGVSHPAQEDPASTVDKVLRSQFSDLEESKRREYAGRITSLFLSAPSRERSARILSALPAAATHHSEKLDFWFRLASKENALSEERKADGYETELEYLVARVNRALRQKESGQSKAIIREQIGTIFRTLEEVLAERLPGESGRHLAGQYIEAYKPTWEAAAGLPFQSPLDRPLSLAEMEQVRAAIHKSAQDFTPTVLKEEDLADLKRLRELGIGDFIERVLDSSYEATRITKNELVKYELRAKAWEDSIQADLAEVRKARQAHAATPKDAIRPSPPKVAHVSSGPPAPEEQDARPAPTTSTDHRSAASAESDSPARPLIILVLVLLAGGLLGATLFLRKRISAS